jgi:hypothetical protein
MATVGDRYRPNCARERCTPHFNGDTQPDAVPKHDFLTM